MEQPGYSVILLDRAMQARDAVEEKEINKRKAQEKIGIK